MIDLLDPMVRLGSETAKNGFRNEHDIAKKFNNWNTDREAMLWLKIMKYEIDRIEFVKAVVVTGHKTDINVQITIKLKAAIDIENLQVKLVSNQRGFNQIDKRWLNNYAEMWSIPASTLVLLKHFTGELAPKVDGTRDSRRMFMDEFSKQEQTEILKFFDKNRVMIVNDILKGRGKFAAEWILVAQRLPSNARWVLKPMNEAISHYFGDGKVLISQHGNLRLGRITIQRKGGDGGRKTANMLQFKIDPTELFNI